uniref:Uncharacterized protein n=1 Tax=Helianthus annuus TaxID=4232 RepID=A0A251UVX6_HELAN
MNLRWMLDRSSFESKVDLSTGLTSIDDPSIIYLILRTDNLCWVYIYPCSVFLSVTHT